MPSKSYRDKNPGNIRFGKFAQTHGATDDGTGFAKFPSVPQGTAALVDLLAGSAYRNLSIRDALHRYAPKSENDTAKYLEFVCTRVKVFEHEEIADLDPYQFLDVVKAIIMFEGWRP